MNSRKREESFKKRLRRYKTVTKIGKKGVYGRIHTPALSLHALLLYSFLSVTSPLTSRTHHQSTKVEVYTMMSTTLRFESIECEDLPSADGSRGTTDPYIVVRCGGSEGTTPYKSNAVNPRWAQQDTPFLVRSRNRGIFHLRSLYCSRPHTTTTIPLPTL